MTWNSGPGDMPPFSSGVTWISTDAYDEPVCITEAERAADEAELEDCEDADE